jgi:hypothetical protein
VKVLFVFREPNMNGKPHAHDMRVEVHDKFFRPKRIAERQDRQRSFWNVNAGLLAHAVDAALSGPPA